MSNFEEVIDKFVINTEAKLLAVVRTAIQSTVEEAQTPRPKGGKMPVDTGFLRWSGLASLNARPSGQGKGRERSASESVGPLAEYSTPRGDILARVLGEMKIGDSFYWGWTAIYARKQEAYNGFLDSAVANFKTHVAKAVAEFRK